MVNNGTGFDDGPAIANFPIFYIVKYEKFQLHTANKGDNSTIALQLFALKRDTLNVLLLYLINKKYCVCM